MVVSKEQLLPFLTKTKPKHKKSRMQKKVSKKGFRKYKVIYRFLKQNLGYELVSVSAGYNLRKNFRKSHYKRELHNQMHLEDAVYPRLDNAGVPNEEQPYHVGYGKRIFTQATKLTRSTREQEIKLTTDEMLKRGLDPAGVDIAKLHSEMLGSAGYEVGIWDESKWKYACFYPHPVTFKRKYQSLWDEALWDQYLWYPKIVLTEPSFSEDVVNQGTEKYIAKTEGIRIAGTILNRYKTMRLSYIAEQTRNHQITMWVRNYLQEQRIKRIYWHAYIGYALELYARLRRLLWDVDQQREKDILKQKWQQRGLDPAHLERIENYISKLVLARF